MKQNSRPSMEELSLYYDGLLDGEAKERVEAALNTDPECRDLLNLFEQFDSTMEPAISESEIDNLLDNTIQQVHERLVEAPRRSEWGWCFIFNPKFLASAFSVLLIVSLVMVDWNPSSVTPQPDNPDPIIAQVPTTNQQQQTIERPELDEIQKKALLALTDTAKTYFNKGLDYAGEKTTAIKETLTNLPEDTQAGMTIGAFKSALSGQKTEKQTPNENSVSQKLVKAGQQQIAIGLGASMLTLITVF